jgi:hypothetical protein
LLRRASCSNTHITERARAREREREKGGQDRQQGGRKCRHRLGGQHRTRLRHPLSPPVLRPHPQGKRKRKRDGQERCCSGHFVAVLAGQAWTDACGATRMCARATRMCARVAMSFLYRRPPPPPPRRLSSRAAFFMRGRMHMSSQKTVCLEESYKAKPHESKRERVRRQ